MKRVFYLLVSVLLMNNCVFADGLADTDLIAATILQPQAVIQTPITVSKVSVSDCCDTINANTEQLFYLTIAALNKLNYKINEVQSKTGTILFQAASREFLVTIAEKDKNNTCIKILPADSNYVFSPAVLNNIFAFVKTNSNLTPMIL